MVSLNNLKAGMFLNGVSSEGPVSIINVEWHGSDMITLTYKDIKGKLGQEIVGRDSESKLSAQAQGRDFLR